MNVAVAGTMASVLMQYLPRLLPEIKINPLPEHIFLYTIKAFLLPFSNLSPSQWGVVGALILATNASPMLRQAGAQLYGYLSLAVGMEITMINVYLLVCSWLSPSTTLQPVTIVTLNLLNNIVPIYTDTVILFQLVKEKASQSGSRWKLIATMGLPVLMKMARLLSVAMYIRTSAEFVIASVVLNQGGILPDFAVVETARTRNVTISSSLQLIDNLYSLSVYWTYIRRMQKLAAWASPLVPKSMVGLAWSLGSQYIIPIALNAAQLVISFIMPSSNVTMVIDSAKVVINIASASVATLRKHLFNRK
ncbi:hypothetical protein BC834DRAFT_99906 [Gloeopeniophorella convolvens]|nr:hypothetical protein BC834DRAFT_99906 [Gloeopeniophorella convolvens]